MERFCCWLRRAVVSNRETLLAAFIVGLLTYGYAFTNKLINYDDAFFLFSKGATIESGRWALVLLSLIFPDVSMPWIYGIITVALIAVSCCVIVDIFEIQSKLSKVLLAALIVCFPSLIATFTYMFTSSSYGVAFLLAVLAVWFLKKGTKAGYCAAFGLMIFSLGIYQSYVALTAGLLVVYLIQQVLRGRESRQIWRKGTAYVMFLGASLGVYFVITKGVQFVTGRSMGSYASGQIDLSVSYIFTKLLTAYRYFLEFFTTGSNGLIPTALSRVIHICLLILSLGYLIGWVKGGARKGLGLLALLLVIFPLSVNCMYLFTKPHSVHTLVLYGFVALYVLFIVLAEHCRLSQVRLFRKWFYDLTAVILAVVVVSNVYVGNQAYLHMFLKYENCMAFYTSLVNDIRATPDFDENTKIALVGSYQLPDSYDEGFADIYKIKGVSGIQPNSYSREQFVAHFFGFDFKFATALEHEQIELLEEYLEMPLYPYHGSIKKIGDYLVVKLSPPVPKTES
ncbi:MAG: glucosyltransferase domain-containing protein [Oscillospiraceae bacterium]|nr:glucosyltransferase domain-containing protein [Oscillospiraceae bacterium]